MTLHTSLPWFLSHNAIEVASQRSCPPLIAPHVESFLTRGYAVIPNSISGALCDSLVARFRAFETAHAGKLAPFRDAHGHYPRLVNLHLALPELFSSFAENPQALALQDFLFDGETCLYTSLFYERGSAQALHRDTPYFCTRPEYRYFGMWVALEDVDEDNGPLMVMEGGHLLGELDRPAIAREILGAGVPIPSSSDALWNAYQTRVTQRGEALDLRVKTLPVSKGTTILWHPQLPHGGAPIRDPARSRLSFVMHTTPEHTPVYHQHVFFAPQEPFPERAPWAYVTQSGRKYARHALVSFNHAIDYDPRELMVA
ncbi:MAG: phytanoyl-CoA dioxygenase family protein [Caulobacterales bacterium]